VIPVPHLPITLPSLESLIIEEGMAPDEAVSAALDCGRPRGFELLCIHDSFEGLLQPELFSMLLEQCVRRDLSTVPLREAAYIATDAALELPIHGLIRAPLSGFVGQVSWQS
jgi:hypothetical protein